MMRAAAWVLLIWGCDPEPPVSSEDAAEAARAAAAAQANSDGTPQRLPPSPADVPGQMLVLAYGDFGPPSMAEPLLGPERYAWAEPCCAEPGDAWDVRVVVHTEGAADAAAQRYPSLPGTSDHRRVGVQAARAHLDAGRTEARGAGLTELAARLEATTARIDAGLGPRD